MISSILVPVDGSSQADKAIVFAAALARRYDAKMTLYHVTMDVRRGTIPPELKAYALSGQVPVNEAFANTSKRILDQSEEKARSESMSAVATISEVGDPATAIIEYSRNKGFDLIVMGSRGLSDLRGLLQGSVSHKVSHLAPCTCITVH